MLNSTPPVRYLIEQDVLIVIPVGNLLEYAESEVRDAYNEIFRRLNHGEINHLLFDLEQMVYMGSTFVGVMIRLARKVRRDNGQCGVCNVNDDLNQLLRSLMLLENEAVNCSWRKFNTRADAFANLSRSTVPSRA